MSEHVDAMWKWFTAVACWDMVCNKTDDCGHSSENVQMAFSSLWARLLLTEASIDFSECLRAFQQKGYSCQFFEATGNILAEWTAGGLLAVTGGLAFSAEDRSNGSMGSVGQSETWLRLWPLRIYQLITRSLVALVSLLGKWWGVRI